VVQLAVADAHAIALKEDGTVWSTGSNSYTGAEEPSTTFIKLGIEDVKHIATYNTNCFFLKQDGSLYGVGSNSFYELGLGDSKTRETFTEIIEYADGTPIKPIVSIDLPTITIINQTSQVDKTTISVTTTPTEKDLEYALNKGTYQDSNEFDITESGDYTISIKEKEETEILDEVTITVNRDQTNNSLSILNTDQTLQVGDTLQLKTETVKLLKARTTSDLTYSSSNPSVATIDDTGKVEALKTGHVALTVSLDDLEDTLELEVLPVTSVIDGNGDIVINGEIQALVLSLTVPQAVDFVINPNTLDTSEMFVSPKFYITNNSALDIGVTVEKLTPSEDSQYTFTDVDKDTFTETEWYRLSPSNSMKYLALRIVPQDKSEWVNNTINECQAIETNIKLGIIPSYKSTTLQLEANHGTALQPVTCKYNTVFVFEIDNLVE
jgi:hypothetical protein